MALNYGGIDKEIENRTDMFRNNPQGLQKRYGQSKELLDLLALQKMKSEQQRVAMNMSLAAEGNPRTIAAQMEEEVLAGTKQSMGDTITDIANRRKGTLDTETAKKKAAVNKLTSAAAKGGLGALTGAGRPAPQINPPVRRLAQGGIVGFAGGEEVNSSPLGRKIMGGITNLTGNLSERLRMQSLQQRIRTKYAMFASVGGSARDQSDEQQAYAKNVVAQIDANKLNEEQLTALGAAEFKAGMNATAVAALPSIPIAVEEVAAEVAAEVAEAEEVNLDENDAPRTYSYPRTSQDPVTEFDGLDLLPVVPTASDPADTTSYDTAVTSMQTAAKQQADTDLLDVDDIKFNELTAVAAPLDAQGKIDRNALLQTYRDDMAVDVGGAEASALKDTDTHLRRAENAQDFRDMRTAEQRLQARIMNPNQLATEARIRTLGAGRRGRGGMSDAYGQVMADQRRDLSGGLATLRGIDEKRISGDLNTAQTSSARGSEAASRASTRRLGGIAGLRSDILAQETRALAGQQQKNTQSTAVYNHESAVAQKGFSSAESAIQRNYSAALSIVVSERSFLKSKNAEIRQFDDNTAAAYRVQTEQKAKVAVERAKIILEQNNKALDSLVEVQKLVDLQERELTKLVAELVQDDPAWIKASEALAEMADKENDPEYKAQVKVARAAYNRYYMQIANKFPKLVGDLSALKELADAIRSLTSLPDLYAQEKDIDSVVRQGTPPVNLAQ